MASPPRLTREKIDVVELLRAASGPGLGGTSIFLGTVRRSEDDGPVMAIEYSAYSEMVESEFEKILTEARDKWPDARFAVQHRIGRIPLGETSIAIIAATLHRTEAFEACRYVIEEVKARLTVWKKEIFEDGSEDWREGRERSADSS
ncbi:MAG: molybdenum cofactor biosynthesis protein MoaE [Gemmatimonadales bacterium]